MADSFDDLRLQRLIDGELDTQEQQEFLASLDRQPGHWREVALAFVEDQVWQKELNPIEAPAEPVALSLPVPSRQRNDVPTMWLAIAMLWLIVVPISYLFGVRRSINGPIATKVDETSSKMLAPMQPVVLAADTSTKQSPQQYADLSEKHTERLVRNGIKAISFTKPSTAKIRFLERLGYDIQLQTKYASYRPNDGCKFVVPVHHVTLQWTTQ